MFKVKYPVVLLFLMAFFYLDSTSNLCYSQWFKSYELGLVAMGKNDWHQAIEHFKKALEAKPKDSNKIRARGVVFIEYYPNREIGICYYNIGQMDNAKQHLSTSLSQIFSIRAKHYLNLLNKSPDSPKTPAPGYRQPDYQQPEYQPPIKQPTNRRTPSVPAQLSVELFFVEPSNNGFLDAEEDGKIIVDVKNNGRGDAFDLDVKLTPESDVSGVNFGYSQKINQLAAGSQQSVIIPVSSSQNINSKQVKFRVDVTELNGFDLDPPAYITFNTMPGSPPDLVVEDVGIEDNSQNRRIEPREIVDITVRIKNLGQGEARSIKAMVEAGLNVFLTPDSRADFSLGNLRQGEFKDITFTVFTNSKATSVPVNIILNEPRGRYNKSIPLDLPFNKPQKKGEDLVVTGRASEGSAPVEGTPLSIDVDTKIPKSKNNNPDAIAIILGVEQYKSIPNVTFAGRDAAIFKEYAVKVLGVPDSKNNIYFKTNFEVTKAEFLKLFTEDGWLKKRVQPTSDVYIYFVGHGAPDIKNKAPYIIPADGDANYPSQTGFNLNDLYAELSKLTAKSINVFLDACFSGGTRENEMLLANARPIMIKVEDPVLRSDVLTVFAASSGEEISSGYPAKQHGLFTYFLFKGLSGEADRNANKSITIAELEQYLVDNVSRTAGTLDREQTPNIMSKNKQKIIVVY